MAITFVNGQGQVSGSGTTSHTSGTPASTQTDDLWVAMCSVQDATTQNAAIGWTYPTGFTEIDSHYGDWNNDHPVGLAYWVQSGSIPTLTFSHDDGAGGGVMGTSIVVFRGVDTSTPFDVTYVRGSHFISRTDDSAEGAAQPITTVTDSAVVLIGQHWNNTSGTGQTVPSGYTKAWATIDREADTNAAHHWCYKTLATAGTETPGARPENGFGASVDSLNVTLALKPAASLSFSDDPNVYKRTDTTAVVTATAE